MTTTITTPDGVIRQWFKEVWDFHTFREALGDLEIAVERTFVDGDWCTALCRVVTP